MFARFAVVGINRCAAAGPGGFPLAGPHAQSRSFHDGVTQRFEQTGALTNACVAVLMAFESREESPPLPAPDKQIALGATAAGSA